MDFSSFGIRAGDDGCTGATVPNGGTCAVKVRFHPDGVGPKSARLRLTDDAVTSPQTVELSGTGTPGPWLTTSPSGLKFGRVPVGTTTAAKQVTLTNTGSAPMQISSITLEGVNPGDFDRSETCTALASLGPDESCSAQVSFHPTATGSRTARLKITDTAPGSPHYVQLQGTGLSSVLWTGKPSLFETGRAAVPVAREVTRYSRNPAASNQQKLPSPKGRAPAGPAPLRAIVT